MRALLFFQGVGPLSDTVLPSIRDIKRLPSKNPFPLPLCEGKKCPKLSFLVVTTHEENGLPNSS